MAKDWGWESKWWDLRYRFDGGHCCFIWTCNLSRLMARSAWRSCVRIDIHWEQIFKRLKKPSPWISLPTYLEFRVIFLPSKMCRSFVPFRTLIPFFPVPLSRHVCELRQSNQRRSHVCILISFRLGRIRVPVAGSATVPCTSASYRFPILHSILHPISQYQVPFSFRMACQHQRALQICQYVWAVGSPGHKLCKNKYE